ncbi:TPA: arylsulfatase [Candidatus Poribacteria bacterium]|nr:arylsulfatase [Candidatus Poribacteria bacterium]
MAKRPNILLITTDQHRGDHLSIAGHPVVETPNLDAFVVQGAYFPNAYSEIPSTTGARLCLLRGRGSYYCGLIGYGAVEWNERNSVAEVLARNGYHCINVGWRNLHPRRKLYGFHTVIPHDLSEGVDDYMEWLRQMAGPHAREHAHGLNPNGWTARPWHLDEALHPVVWTVNTTIEQIKKRDPTRPFFVWCSFLRPHSPYDPPGSFWDMFIHRDLPEIPIGDWAQKYDVPNPGLPITAWYGRLTPQQNQRMRAAYMAMISFIDSQIGYLLLALQRDLGVLEDTLVIFTSDHGDMMGDHHLHRKSYAYEGSARIPLLIRYPKGWDLPRGVFEHVVGLQDIMPTILEAAGIKPVEGMTGKSLLKAIRGGKWREFIHGEHSPCYSVQEAMHYLTDGREKYIWFPASGGEMLFDLLSDREERHNLADDPKHGEKVKMWRCRLIQLLARRGDGFSDGRKLLMRAGSWGPVVRENLS